MESSTKASVDERSRKLIAECKRLGIEDADIRSASLQIGPAYEYRSSERKFVGTRVHREIDVTLRNLDQYPELIKALVSAPIAEIESTSLSSSKAAKTLEQAQQLALADARARAERLAAASGQELGPAHSISEFDQRLQEKYSLPPARGMGRDRRFDASDIQALGAENREPFEPGTIVATATVYVVYLLE